MKRGTRRRATPANGTRSPRDFSGREPVRLKGKQTDRTLPVDFEDLLLQDVQLDSDAVHGVPGRCMISNNSNGLWGFTFVFFSPSFRLGFPAVCSGRTAIRDQSSPRSVASRGRHAHELRLYVGSSLQLLSTRRRKRRWTRRLARSVQSASASYAPALPVSVSHKGLRGEIPWEPGGSESPDGRSPAWVCGLGRSRVRPGRTGSDRVRDGTSCR